MRIFVDASVLFSAVQSSTGASRELLNRSLTGEVELVASPYILAEAERNLKKKAPKKAILFQPIVDLVDFEVIQPEKEQIEAVMEYTKAKDAPVVAAALLGNCEYLVTFDDKHLLKPEVAQKSGLKIVKPGVIIRMLRSEEDDSE